MKISSALLSASIVLMFAAGSASAASSSYFMDQSNDLADGVNYAKVTIDDDGAVGDINFTVEIIASAFPTPFSNFGMQTFSFNYDAVLDMPLGNISDANIVNVDPGSWGILNDKNAGGGFGKFDFQATGDGSSRTSILTFSISGVAGDTIDSYALGSADDSGEYFAAHIAGYGDGDTGNTSGQFAGSTAVPIPAAVWLFGSGLGMLGWMRRRKSAV
jgi:hypothetical protein